MDLEVDETSEPLNFSLILPSLKELSLIRLSRSLWRTPQILSIFHPSKLETIPVVRNEYLVNERTTETEVLKQIPSLPLPEQLKKQLKPVVHYVGKELLLWLQPFENALGLYCHRYWTNQIFQDYLYNDRLSWNAYGAIDAPKIAKALLREDVIPVDHRFDLSCKLCLEEEVRRLWLEIEQSENTFGAKLEGSRVDPITDYFAFKMRNKSWVNPNSNNNSESPEEFILERALHRNFSTFGSMFEYFWPKLNDVQRENITARMKSRIVIANSYLFESFFVLLNSMGVQRQREFLRAAPCEILLKCLSRPWQHMFLPTLKVTMEHISEGHFFSLLHCVSLDQCDDYMRDLFFTQLRPLIVKHVYNNDSATINISITRNVLEIVKRIMADGPQVQKHDLIVRSFPREVNASKLDIVKVLVMEWVTSNEAWVNLKSRLIRKFSPDSAKKFDDFFLYFDHFFADKR